MELQNILELHKKWLNDDPEGERADLRGADLDFSCLPLWRGSLTAHFDDIPYLLRLELHI